MQLDEIVFPETKPETEWVRGRALQKVSPTYWHASVQAKMARALMNWAEEHERGRVGTEWRFRVTPTGERTRPLVPDVAFLSYVDLPKSAREEEVDVPKRAPSFVVEVRSPDDRSADVRDKICTYLASGTSAVLVIDPAARNAELNDRSGTRVISEFDRIDHASLPGFSVVLQTLFAAD
jgi:Uma2 family endonuclease